MAVIGWDIGGVNTKVARVDGGAVRAVKSGPYEIQRAPSALVRVLKNLAAEIEAPADAPHAVTMTAELSQLFRTKREGVAFVLDAIEEAFRSSRIDVYAVHGGFLDPKSARAAPLDVAAANWAATARLVAGFHPDALLVDIGTTTADIIPIAGGDIRPTGWSDPDRLASGELVYTGALRTPVEGISASVPYGGGMAGVSAEAFALAGDVHVWRGDLDPADYSVATPDGRPATREFAGERLARVVCADRDLVDDRGISAIADALAAAQVDRIAAAIRRVVARHPSIETAVVTGLGAFLGERAARAAGLAVVPLAAELGDTAARCAPAACVALLLERQISQRPKGLPPVVASGLSRKLRTRVDLVVKLGGGVLAQPNCFDRVLDAIVTAARERPLLIVPGGGPFADAIRNVDRRIALSDDAAHWMAILAMDQYAHLIASRLRGSVIVESRHEIDEALRRGLAPVLAPSRWLREVDPLPHSWDVTSDSIAAWVAREVGARELVLIKPAHASGDTLVDRYFSRVLPASVTTTIIPADNLEFVASGLSRKLPGATRTATR